MLEVVFIEGGVHQIGSKLNAIVQPAYDFGEVAGKIQDLFAALMPHDQHLMLSILSEWCADSTLSDRC